MIGDFLKGFQLMSQRSPNPFQLIFVDIWNNIIEANIKAFTNIDEIVEFTIRLAKDQIQTRCPEPAGECLHLRPTGAGHTAHHAR